jgi:hypothetical protein
MVTPSTTPVTTPTAAGTANRPRNGDVGAAVHCGVPERLRLLCRTALPFLATAGAPASAPALKRRAHTMDRLDERDRRRLRMRKIVAEQNRVRVDTIANGDQCGIDDLSRDMGTPRSSTKLRISRPSHRAIRIVG